MKTLRESLFYYLWVGMLVFSIGELTTALRARADEDSRPLVDTRCELTPEARLERIQIVDRHLHVMDGLIRSSRGIFDEYDGLLRQTNRLYGYSRDAMTVSAMASMLSGAAGFYQVFALGQATTILHVIPLSLNASRAYVAGSMAYRLYGLPRQLQALRNHDIEIDEKVLRQHEREVAELESKPWFSAKAVAFLSNPEACRTGGCSWLQPELEAGFRKANALYQADLKRLSDSDSWWKPDAYSHLMGRTLAEVHLPWNAALIEILMLKKAYAESVKATLLHDGAACARR